MTSNPNHAEQQRNEALALILWFEDLRREDVGRV